MFLQRTTKVYGRQTPSPTSFHHSHRYRTFLLVLLLLPTDLCRAQKAQVTLSRGPSTGIITQEIPNLLLTEHRIINQLMYINLDIEKVLEKFVSLSDISDVEILLWYDRHIERTRDTIRDILSQAEKTIIQQQPPPGRPRRAIAAVVMGVMDLLTVVGTVVGSTMNAVNSISIKEVQQQSDHLQGAIKEIQKSLAIQRDHTTNLL